MVRRKTEVLERRARTEFSAANANSLKAGPQLKLTWVWLPPRGQFKLWVFTHKQWGLSQLLLSCIYPCCLQGPKWGLLQWGGARPMPLLCPCHPEPSWTPLPPNTPGLQLPPPTPTPQLVAIVSNARVFPLHFFNPLLLPEDLTGGKILRSGHTAHFPSPWGYAPHWWAGMVPLTHSK